ncbi:CoA-binding protein [Chloroflexota bacterium]
MTLALLAVQEDFGGNLSILEKDFFAPHSVAIIGASNSPDKLGHAIVRNILDSGYPGKVYPVNPGESEVLSLPCYPSVTKLPDKPDMALIAVASKAVLTVLNDCAKKGIKGVVMISAGFKEAGEQGSKLEKDLLILARNHGIKMLGPNDAQNQGV